jgi:glycosyltransferase involved in cell wall biosynthesis
LRRSLGLCGQTVIGFVGWFRNWHGLGMLLEAFHGSGLAAQNTKILLIGDGPAMPELREYVRRHGLESSVLFTGPLPHAEVPRYLDLIDIAVQPAGKHSGAAAGGRRSQVFHARRCGQPGASHEGHDQ